MKPVHDVFTDFKLFCNSKEFVNPIALNMSDGLFGNSRALRRKWASSAFPFPLSPAKCM